MEHKFNNISIQLLNSILQKLNDKKIIRNPKPQIYNVDKILSVNTRMCRYNASCKQHLHVKFTSPDENGTICLSILIDAYSDLF